MQFVRHARKMGFLSHPRTDKRGPRCSDETITTTSVVNSGENANQGAAKWAAPRAPAGQLPLTRGGKGRLKSRT
jgi:hypothetical protein